MRTFENYLVFSIYALRTVLAACNGSEHQQFYNEMLDLHNEYRNKHDSKPLKLSDKMCEDTMEFIKNWIQREHGEQQGNWIYAKNVSYHPYKSKDNEEVSAKNIFFFWYKEGNDYNYSHEHKYKNAENFTQIVWKSTTEVGFALMYVNNKFYFTATYCPTGNLIGEYVQNVEKPKKIDNNQLVNKFTPLVN